MREVRALINHLQKNVCAEKIKKQDDVDSPNFVEIGYVIIRLG